MRQGNFVNTTVQPCTSVCVGLRGAKNSSHSIIKSCIFYLSDGDSREYRRGSNRIKETAGLTTPLTETTVLAACRTLFGSDVNIGLDFLRYLQPSGAKSAFRRIAKETHPDLFAAQRPEIQQKQNDLFRHVLQAYELLNVFFRRRDDGLWMPSDRFSTQDLRRQARRETARGERFYTGSMPHRPLEIGLYLYYRGAIPYRALIDALVWQRGQRPSIGDIAKRWKWLHDEDIAAILSLRGKPLRFGEKAVELGVLTPFHVKAILWYQRSQQERLGQYFVKRGYLTANDLERFAKELHHHNFQARNRNNGPWDRN